MQNNYKVVCMAGRQVMGSGFARCYLYHLKKPEPRWEVWCLTVTHGVSVPPPGKSPLGFCG